MTVDVSTLPTVIAELPAGAWLLELAHVLREAEPDESGRVVMSHGLALAIARRAERIALALGAAVPC